MAQKLLTEFNDFTYDVLEEDRPNPKGGGTVKKTMLKGLFQHGGVRNGNGRMYPTPILEREIQKNMEKVQSRNMLGELDHPTEGKIHLDKVSHLITELNMTPDGRVMGSVEVFDGPDELGGTPKGRTLGSLIKRNVKLGISSRGFGSTKEDGDVNEVQDDFRLITFDIVADPSTPGAYPQAVYEDKNPEAEGWVKEEKNSRSFAELLQENLED
jgi:Prohead core protein serine protease